MLIILYNKNNTMLGRGAPVERDNLGYNRPVYILWHELCTNSHSINY